MSAHTYAWKKMIARMLLSGGVAVAGLGAVAATHPTNGMVKVVASQPLLLHADDPVTLVTVTDVTDWLWTTETAHYDPFEL
ncbi:MAG: hypothetical protein WBF57_11625 [Mycobacterium sp.]